MAREMEARCSAEVQAAATASKLQEERRAAASKLREEKQAADRETMEAKAKIARLGGQVAAAHFEAANQRWQSVMRRLEGERTGW